MQPYILLLHHLFSFGDGTESKRSLISSNTQTMTSFSAFPSLTFPTLPHTSMMDINDEAAVLQILSAVQIPLNQVDSRTFVNSQGRVTKLRLNPCFELDGLPPSMGDLTQLEEVYLFWGGSRFVSLDADVLKKLNNLRILQLRWCSRLRSFPPSIGRSLVNLRQLTLEGCTALEDVSFLKEARYAWVNLTSLHLFSSENSNIVDVLTDDVEEPTIDNKKEFFPSLESLCLRRNGITGEAFGKLWSFLEFCPRLSVVDVRENNIDTLEYFAKAAAVSSIDNNNHRHCPLRKLNLARNPIMLKETLSLFTSTDGVVRTLQSHPRESSQEEEQYMIQILSICPHLDCIHECEGPLLAPPTSVNRHCLVDSSLHSPKLQHALDLNHTSRGKSLLLKNRLPLSMWPVVLERAAKVSRATQQGEETRKARPLCQNCGGEDGSVFLRREASVLFSLLKGPVFASRENQA